jgi:hypothetical protein
VRKQLCRSQNDYVEIILKLLKYSYENHNLWEITITGKLIPNRLLNYFELSFLKCSYSGMKQALQTTSDIFFFSTNIRSLVETQNGRYDTYRREILSTQTLFCLPNWLHYYEVNKGWNTCRTDLSKIVLQRIFIWKIYFIQPVIF